MGSHPPLVDGRLVWAHCQLYPCRAGKRAGEEDLMKIYLSLSLPVSYMVPFNTSRCAYASSAQIHEANIHIKQKLFSL